MKRIFLIFIFSLLSGTVFAQSVYQVSTIERKPFAFRQDGEWTGFSIELWEKIATALGAETQFKEHLIFADMLQSAIEGKADLAAANISVTSEREKLMDFTQPIFDSGLAILTPIGDGSSIFDALLNPQLFLLALAAIGLFVLAGGMIAFFERKHPHFDGLKKPKSLEEGMWWAISVVTNASFTIFTPLTAAGRMLSYVLILVGLFVVSAFVAQITASLTVQELRAQIDSVTDLDGRRVGTTAGSTSSRYLTQRDIKHRTYADLGQLYEELRKGKLDAIVHDAPILAYFAQNEGRGEFEVASRPFNPEKYGFALPQRSNLREEINRELLRLRESGEYGELVRKWFGSDYES